MIASMLGSGVTGRPAVLAKNGMVATPHYLATAAGSYILQRGGSAVDAAIAANAVLCVAYPHMAGLGGDCFWLLWSARDQRLLALNGSGRSAHAATIDSYTSRGYHEIPMRGALAALTVPGAIDGWFCAHQRMGFLPWRQLFDGAISYAEQGVPVSRSLATCCAENRDILVEQEPTARIFLPNGNIPQVGDILVQRDLAQSLRLIADGGRDAFYEGPIAHSITRGLQNAGGMLSIEDFREHRSDWVEPLGTRYRGISVNTLPPNSQGLSLLMVLSMVEAFDVRQIGDRGPDYLHVIVEATKLAFADRDRWVSDPRSIRAPVDTLLSKAYTSERRMQIDPRRALGANEVRPGQLRGDGANVPRGGMALAPERRSDTVYICAVDKDGNAASLIESIYHPFGSATLGGNTGIILQNRGCFFPLDARHVNHLEPNKRTLHTLMPSMILRNGLPYVVLGTMGGEGQPQTQAALITRIVDFGYDPQQAVEAPRWLQGRTWGQKQATLKLEDRFPKDVAQELRRRGHNVEIIPGWAETMGHAQVIIIDQETGVLAGGADPRGDGAAIGW